jgi:DNA-binding response OmpR family regulator
MRTVAHPAWIGIAEDGPLHALASGMPAAQLRVVRDEAVFTALLFTARPQVAIVASTAASQDLVRTVLRERRRRAVLRLVHLTPSAAVAARVDALRSGFDEALPDTVDHAELLARLELLEERARVRTASSLPIGDGVLLDRVAHEVRRDGELVHLRPKEYQLLATLASHPGRAYSRRQLLDRVWGTDHDGDPRTVDVHVRWLRSKIERHPEAPVHLVTVRGVGYRLDPQPR